MKRQKRKCRNGWRQYESGKKAIAARGLSTADYEKAIRQLARRWKL